MENQILSRDFWRDSLDSATQMPYIVSIRKRGCSNGTSVTARKKTNNKWFETQDAIKYWDDFSKPKIIWGNLCLSAQFSYSEDEIFINAPASMIVPGNKYLLAILNSKLADWYIRNLGVTRNGGYFEYKPMFVNQLPVPIISDAEQGIFSEMVSDIIGNDVNPDEIAILEKRIDDLVFDMYGLSELERAHIIDTL